MLASLPLAVGALIAARPFPRAAVRYRILACAYVLAAAVGPLALAAASLRTAPLVTVPPVLAAAGVSPGGADAFALLALPLLAVAAAVAGALLLDLAADVVKLRRVKRGAVPLGTVGIRRARLGTSPAVATPTAVGYLHPAVVLPEGFRAQVDEREWDAVVAHECAHLARRDDWAKAAQSAVLRAVWWLPGLWVLGRALDLERELASDERAAYETGPRRYAACLLRLATDRCSGAVAPAFGGRRSHVAIRVERLLRPVADGGPVMRAIALGAFTAAAFATVAAAVLAVPGTGARVAGTGVRGAHAVPHRAQLAIGHAAALRHAVPRVARPVRRPAPHLAAGTVASAAATRSAVSAQLRTPALLPVPAQPAKPVAPAPAIVRAAPPSAVTQAAPRAGAGRATAPAVRRTAPDAALAFVLPHRRCPTCFGPLRSPEDAGSPSTAPFAPPARVASGSVAAAAADDATSGPVDLSSPTIWLRIPARALQSPY